MPSQINASNSGFGGIVSTGDSSGVLELQTTGTTAVTIDTSQRVGFVAGTAAAPAITRTGDTNTGMFFPAADTIAFSEGGAEAMRLDSVGNVGIGTTSPAQKLEINTSVNAQTWIGLRNLNSGSSSSIGLLFGNNDNNAYGSMFVGSTTYGSFGGANSINLGTYSAAPTVFFVNNVERMRIGTDGGLYVNSTSRNGNTLQRMGLRYDGSVEWGLSFQNNWSGNAGSAINFNNFSGTQVGTIQPGSSSTSYVTSSDYRLKENVIPMTGALDKIAKLKPVTYTWKNTDGEQGEGFIAHELAEVCPLAVSGKKDEVNKDGSIKPQGIDTSFLVATLTAAIQEQQTIINDLKARIETLETK